MRSMPIRIVAALAAVLVLGASVAAVDAGADKKNKAASRAADCPPQPAASPGTDTKAKVPDKLEGEVTAVDPTTGALTLRAADGSTHQFRGNIDTLRDYKVGDQVQLSLRSAPNC